MGDDVDLGNYVTVPERLRLALAKYPELRVQESNIHTVQIGESLFISVTMTVWRDPLDELPSVAAAFEVFPGRTAFQRGSEMMNASTSALGRALGLMGFGIATSIASADEISFRVQERQTVPKPTQNAVRAPRADETTNDDDNPPPTSKQLDFLIRLAGERGVTCPEVNTMADASAAIKTLTGLPKKKAKTEDVF